MEFWVYLLPTVVALLVLGSILPKRPHPKLEAVVPWLESGRVKGNCLTGRYQGRSISIRLDSRELECSIECQPAFRFKGKTRRPGIAYNRPNYVASNDAWLDERAVFKSFEPERLSAWFRGGSGLEALRGVFEWHDVEIKAKPQFQKLKVEWEQFPQEELTPTRVQQLLNTLYALARSLETSAGP